MSTLYIVGTPIGNLGDITFRAIEVLKKVDVILCEDTRVTKKLLNHYEIANKQLITYNQQQSGASKEKIVAILESGKDIALVSDAGTPGISDPGSLLVSHIRTNVSKVEIESVPGPSALTTAISIAGVPLHDFVFLGFLPHKKGRETLFKEIGKSKRTMIFYESPHRIVKALESLKEFAPDKEVIIARELTKMFEEVKKGSAEELLKFFSENEEKVRGEFVVLVADKTRILCR